MILSQRRADAVREVLVNTFKISAKRIQSLGVGEEQFIDQAQPGLAGQSADPDSDHGKVGTNRRAPPRHCGQEAGEEKEVAAARTLACREIGQEESRVIP